MGIKNPNSTSAVLLTECSRVRIFGDSDHPRWGGMASCGGDNPLFIGWPIAYEWQPYKAVTVTFGWFHMSSWFDGSNVFSGIGDKREVHMDCMCLTSRWNWSKMRNRK